MLNDAWWFKSPGDMETMCCSHVLWGFWRSLADLWHLLPWRIATISANISVGQRYWTQQLYGCDYKHLWEIRYPIALTSLPISQIPVRVEADIWHAGSSALRRWQMNIMQVRTSKIVSTDRPRKCRSFWDRKESWQVAPPTPRSFFSSVAPPLCSMDPFPKPSFFKSASLKGSTVGKPGFLLGFFFRISIYGSKMIYHLAYDRSGVPQCRACPLLPLISPLSTVHFCGIVVLGSPPCLNFLALFVNDLFMTFTRCQGPIKMLHALNHTLTSTCAGMCMQLYAYVYVHVDM